jgi:hypothetical protein
MNYAALIKNGKELGFLPIDHLKIEFLDELFQMGYEFKKLTKSEFDILKINVE